MEKDNSFAMIAMVAIVAVVGLVVLIVGGKSSTQIQPVPVSVGGDLSGQAGVNPKRVIGADNSGGSVGDCTIKLRNNNYENWNGKTKAWCQDRCETLGQCEDGEDPDNNMNWECRFRCPPP